MDIIIFFTIDDKFTKHCSATIASILANSAQSDKIFINVLSSDLSYQSKCNLDDLSKIKDFKLNFYNVDDELFKNYQTPSYINSSSSLYRYLIPTIAPQYDKILYLDSDVIVKGSLSELFRTDLDENYIAGVEDAHNIMAIKRLKLNSSIEEPYFNSGVLLINAKKWREDNLLDKLFEQTNKLNPKMLEQTDQDAINIVCKSKKTILHPKYNLLSCFNDKFLFTSYSKEEVDSALKSPIIVHYSGDKKPWHINTIPLNDFYYDYHKYLNLTNYSNRLLIIVLSLFNPKVKKAIKQLKYNCFLKTAFDLFILPIQIFRLFLNFTKFFQYYKKFK